MATINPTSPVVFQPATGAIGRLTLGTNDRDHFINLAWGDLVFGGNGDDVFDFTSNIGKLRAGAVARVYGDDNGVWRYGVPSLGRNPANGDHTAPHVPGASMENAGSDFVNGAAGVWATLGNGDDTFIFHGRGDRSNPGIFFGFDPLVERDKIGLDHDQGIDVLNIKFSNAGTQTDAQGRIYTNLASLDLQAHSENPASPNACMRLVFDIDLKHDDRRGTPHPVRITDMNRDGHLVDDAAHFVDAGHDGLGLDWILA